MLEIFSYDFMQRAFIAAICISIMAPCIGTVIVLKRLSAIGDATSHSALAGIAAGLAFGFNPILGAICFSLVAVFAVEGFRKAFSKFADITPIVVLSAGVGLTALFSGFIDKGGTSLNSFLFGSIVAVSKSEMYLTILLSVVVLAVSVIFYRELFYVTFDEESARLSRVPVSLVNLIILVMCALTVSVASRIVGALMVSSLMVIPVACAMIVSKSYKSTMIFSVLFALLFTVLGLFLSFYVRFPSGDLKPGGTIVLTGVITLIALIALKKKK